jgi:hypothetical protein
MRIIVANNQRPNNAAQKLITFSRGTYNQISDGD